MENLKQLRNFLIRRNCVNWIAAIHAVNHPRKTRVKRREKEREGEKIETEGKRKKRRGEENERERENGMREEWRKIDTGVCSSGARMKALEIPANLSRRFSLHFPADYLRSPPLAPFPHHADRNSARWGTFQICFRGRGRGGRFCNRGCGFEKSVCHAHGSIRFPRNLLPSFYLHRVLPLLPSSLPPSPPPPFVRHRESLSYTRHVDISKRISGTRTNFINTDIRRVQWQCKSVSPRQSTGRERRKGGGGGWNGCLSFATRDNFHRRRGIIYQPVICVSASFVVYK